MEYYSGYSDYLKNQLKKLEKNTQLNVDTITQFCRYPMKSEKGVLSEGSCRYLGQSVTNHQNLQGKIVPKTEPSSQSDNLENESQTFYLNQGFKENGSSLGDSVYPFLRTGKNENVGFHSCANSNYRHLPGKPFKSRPWNNTLPQPMIVPEDFFTSGEFDSNQKQNSSEYLLPNIEPFEVPELIDLYFVDILLNTDSPPSSPCVETVSNLPHSPFNGDKTQFRVERSTTNQNMCLNLKEFQFLPDTPYVVYRNSGGTLTCSTCLRPQINQWTIICGADNSHIFCLPCVKRYILRTKTHFCPSGVKCCEPNSQTSWKFSETHINLIFKQ